MDQWERAVTFMVEDVQRQIEEMRALTIAERSSLETELKANVGAAALPEHLPLYTFVNALTHTAKTAAPARRLELETLAGEVLHQHVGGA
jgi:hypothetical protein